MLQSNGLIRLLLKRGKNTTREELEENYQKLRKFVHTEGETKKLEEIYGKAIQFLTQKRERKTSSNIDVPKEEKRKDFVEKILASSGQDTSVPSEYLQQLIKSLKPSVYFLPKKEQKKMTKMIVFSGILTYRTPFGMTNYINAYQLKREGEYFYTLLDVPSLDEDDYRRFVEEKLFSKKNLEEAKKRGGYLGIIRKGEKQKNVFELDEEQMAACLAYEQKSKERRKWEEGRE